MKTTSILSGVALALLLGTAPAGAVSLNLGGDGGLLSSGDSDSGASVSVDSEGLDADVKTRIQLLEGDLDGDGVVDVLGDKPLLDTGGDHLVTVDTDDDDDALVTLFGGQDGAPLQNVGVEADVLEPDRDEEVYVRLFGAGDGNTTATVDLGGDGSGVIGNSGGDAEVDAALTLFGPADGGDAGGAGGSGGKPMARSAGGGGGDPGIDDTTTASTASTGGNARAGQPAAAAPMPATQPAPTQVAATAATGAARDCFSPNATQIEHLLGRSSYGPGDAEQWQQAARIDVVPVHICPDAEARLQAAIAADPEISFLQNAVAGDAKLVAELAPHSPQKVLAVEQANEEMTVYVY